MPGVLSPQAVIPNFEPAQYVRSYKKPLDPGVPNTLALTADTATAIFTNATQKPPAKKIVLHNTGIVPVKYCLNETVTASLFTDVLAAGSAASDGLGSLVEFNLEEVNISKISIMAVGGAGQVNVIMFLDEVQFGV